MTTRYGILCVAMLAAMVWLTPGSARAGGEFYFGFGGGHGYDRHYRYRDRRHYRDRYRQRRHYRRHGYGCHPVSKIGYDHYGRRVKYGGTMCYDHDGYGYIVPGSRHIIHYYYY